MIFVIFLSSFTWDDPIIIVAFVPSYHLSITRSCIYHTHTHTHTHTHIHTDRKTDRQTHIRAYIRTYIHTYIYTYTHTHIHRYKGKEGVLTRRGGFGGWYAKFDVDDSEQYFNTGGVAGGVFQLVYATSSPDVKGGGGGGMEEGEEGDLVTSERVEVGWAVAIAANFVLQPFCETYAGLIGHLHI